MEPRRPVPRAPHLAVSLLLACARCSPTEYPACKNDEQTPKQDELELSSSHLSKWPEARAAGSRATHKNLYLQENHIRSPNKASRSQEQMIFIRMMFIILDSPNDKSQRWWRPEVLDSAGCARRYSLHRFVRCVHVDQSYRREVNSVDLFRV